METSSPMVRPIKGLALAVSWVAQELIYLGQILIRTAYGWLRWSERHVNSRSPLPSRLPSAGAPANENEGCRTPPAETYSAKRS